MINSAKRLGVTLVCAIVGCAFSASAQSLEMTKIVLRYSSPEISADSFATKPKTVYRVGDKYSRIEEQPDPQRNVQIVIITKEPDSWTIDLVSRTAQHIVDPGPSFNARIPILWSPTRQGQSDADKELTRLEYGGEAHFFRLHDQRDLGVRTTDNKECQVFAIKVGARQLVLMLDKNTQKPVQIDVSKDGKPEFSVHYISYETGLPFDPSLFELPQGLKVTESKSK
jgi:hypothetical protein